MEPWLKYSIGVVADRGLKPSQCTSARLKKEVLYVETHSKRYELACENPGEDDNAEDKFKFSACKVPMPLSGMIEVGMPLPNKHTTVIAKGILWEDIKWGASGVSVCGEKYPIVRLQFLPRTAATGVATKA